MDCSIPWQIRSRRSSMFLYNFDEWNASFVAMAWVVIVNMMWAACMWGPVWALKLRIVQDLRESRCRGHDSWGTSKTWFDRGSVEVVRVFVGRSHPLSFGYSCSLATMKSTSFAINANASHMASCILVHSLPWTHCNRWIFDQLIISAIKKACYFLGWGKSSWICKVVEKICWLQAKIW